MTTTITRMTMELYKQIVRDMPPTPSKFHYIFNLRDLSRIYNGLCLSTPDRFKKPDQMIRLWFNEVNRVICDRLITADDKEHIKVCDVTMYAVIHAKYRNQNMYVYNLNICTI